MTLDAADLRSVPGDTLETWTDRKAQEVGFDMVILDWMAERIDKHLQSNMVEGDKDLAAILHEWKTRMVFDPSGLGN